MSSKTLFVYLFCLSLFTSLSADIFTNNWGNDEGLHVESDILLHLLNDWNVKIDGQQSTVNLPLFSDDADSITLSKTFLLNIDSTLEKIALNGLGFKGNADIYFNNTFIEKLTNSSSPFSIEIPTNIIKKQNEIKIILTRSKDLIEGFPVYTKLLTEPDYIGVTRPFWLSLNALKLIENFIVLRSADGPLQFLQDLVLRLEGEVLYFLE